MVKVVVGVGIVREILDLCCIKECFFLVWGFRRVVEVLVVFLIIKWG